MSLRKYSRSLLLILSSRDSQPRETISRNCTSPPRRVCARLYHHVRRLFTVMEIHRIFAVVLMCVVASGCTFRKGAPSTANVQIQQAIIDGSSLWEVGKLDEAEVAFQKVLALDTNNAERRATVVGWVHRIRRLAIGNWQLKIENCGT